MCQEQRGGGGGGDTSPLALVFEINEAVHFFGTGDQI